LAEQIARDIKPGDIVSLYGDLGSGKTTFTRYFVEALGISTRVQSPTFVIHRVYKNENTVVNHFDLYRLTSLEDVLDMGLKEILEDISIKLIEWPEVANNILSKYKVKELHFSYASENERKICLKNISLS